MENKIVVNPKNDITTFLRYRKSMILYMNNLFNEKTCSGYCKGVSFAIK